MNPRPPSAPKRPVITLLLICLIALMGYAYFQNPPADDDDGLASGMPEFSAPAPPPDGATAMKDLLGADPAQVKADDSGKESSVLFQQNFDFGPRHYHVAFIKTRAAGADGQVTDCHACGAQVGAITYQWTGWAWQPVAKQPDIATLGAWGDLELTQVPELLNLSPNSVAFSLDSSYLSQGISSSGKTLLGFAGKEWRELGQIRTGGSNAGACDEDADPRDPAGAGPCWEYTGVVSVATGQESDYPDLLVIRSGTEPAANGAAVIPARNVTYAYDGKAYVAKAP